VVPAVPFISCKADPETKLHVVNVSCSTSPAFALAVPITRRQLAPGIPPDASDPDGVTVDTNVPVDPVSTDVPHTLWAPLDGIAPKVHEASHPVFELEYEPDVTDHRNVNEPLCPTIATVGTVVVDRYCATI